MRSQLSAYADGELTPVMTQQVREHLAGCDHCAREHAGLKSLVTLTAAIPFEDVPGSLHQRIMASLNQAAFTPEPMQVRMPRRSAAPRAWAWAAFATGVIAVGCGALQQRPMVAPGQPDKVLAADVTPTSQGAVAVTPRRTVSAETPDHADLKVTPPAEATPVLEARAADTTAPTPDIEDKQASVAVGQPTSLPASRPVAGRTTGVTPVAGTERPQPAVVNTGGKPATEPRVVEPSLPVGTPMMARENLMSVPGDPIVNSTGPLGPPEPVVTPEKDPSMRMVGMAMETESPGEEDEGLRTFRMFLQENNRTVPQPPSATPGRERRMRKSL